MAGNIIITNGGTLEKMIFEIDQIAGPPGFKTIGKLEAALAAAFADTQTVVHVITGSLKLSGKTSTTFEGSKWSGEITYGGPSSGVNDPVEYAIFELARGGTHDFFRELPFHEEDFADAMSNHFEHGD